MTRLIRKSDALKFVPRSRTNLNDWHLNLCRHLTLSKDPPPQKKIKLSGEWSCFSDWKCQFISSMRETHFSIHYAPIWRWSNFANPYFATRPLCFLVHLNEVIDRLLEFWSQAMFSASSFHSMVERSRVRSLLGAFLLKCLPPLIIYAHRNLLSIVFVFFFHLMVFIGEKFNLKIQGTLFFLELLNHKYHWKWCILMQILTWRYMLHFFGIAES